MYTHTHTHTHTHIYIYIYIYKEKRRLKKKRKISKRWKIVAQNKNKLRSISKYIKEISIYKKENTIKTRCKSNEVKESEMRQIKTF